MSRSIGVLLVLVTVLASLGCANGDGGERRDDTDAAIVARDGGDPECAPSDDAPCGLTPQCGCPDGQACYANGASRRCAPVGSGTEGDACIGSSSCAAGLDCIDFSRDADGSGQQCARYCERDEDCGDALCQRALRDASGATIPGTRLCSAACDPIAQTGCAAGLACNLYQTAATSQAFSDCAGPAGTHGPGDTCTTDAECQPGSACARGACAVWCDRSVGCSDGATCEGFTPPLVVGGLEYGVCL